MWKHCDLQDINLKMLSSDITDCFGWWHYESTNDSHKT